MENLIEAIRTALRDDADPVARRAGVVACRKILAALEAATDNAPEPAASSEPTAAPSSTALPAPALVQPAAPVDPAAVATLIATIGKLPPEQLLDLAISRLRAALPPGASVPAPTPLRFQIVPLHHLGRAK
jgi:hypothetical protein